MEGSEDNNLDERDDKKLDPKLEKKQNKQLFWVLFLMIAIVLIVVLVPYIKKEVFSKFEYANLNFYKTRLGGSTSGNGAAG